jgi:phosphatidate cytidylyltransferase
MGDPAGKGATGDIKAGFASDLRPRVVSGLLLAGLALLLDYYGGTPFAFLVLAVALAMSWEWGRIVRAQSFDAAFLAHAAGVVASVLLAELSLAALAVVAAVVAAVTVLPLSFGRRGLLSAIGVLYVCIPAITLVWLRGDARHGFQAVLYLLLLVAMTDISAYFGGRLVGGPKLWPRISPNKTWAGLVTGVAASVAAGAAFAQFVAGASPGRLAVGGLLIGLLAQCGDLAESALKRDVGVKDASQLLPGHGGFLDRMDGVVLAATAVGLYAALSDPASPGRAVLLGG